jgi:hypothetical protein
VQLFSPTKPDCSNGLSLSNSTSYDIALAAHKSEAYQRRFRHSAPARNETTASLKVCRSRRNRTLAAKFPFSSLGLAGVNECNRDFATSILIIFASQVTHQQWIVAVRGIHNPPALFAMNYWPSSDASFRRQIDCPGAPIASAPSVAGSGVGAVRDAGFGCSMPASSSGPLVLPVMMGLFAMVS